MKVNFWFLNRAVWGSIALLLLVIMGCSVPSGPDERKTISDSSTQETTGDEDGEDEEERSGENQQQSAEDEDNEDEEERSGENQQQSTDEEEIDEDWGFLSWNIEYPEEKVWGAAATVSLKIDENTFIPYTYVDLAGAGNKKVSLPPGTYLVESRFLSHNVEETSPTETLRIDSGQEAVSTQVAISGTAFPEPQGFSSAEALKEYLDRQPENTKDNPYRIKFAGADLSSKETKGETLNTLYKVINRYVTLDLRGCTGKELIAASTARLSNRGKIVSLVLPDSVTEINANGFSGYTSLKSVVMPKVKTIHPSAFKNCLALETVFAPELETVIEATTNDAGAFAGCTALKALYCPSLVTLGKYAVYGCTSLTEAAFPRLETIGGLAFKRCATLKALSLPKIKNIDDGGFEEDSALLYLIFGDPPEFDETTVFRSTDFSKKGTIYVPSDSLDAYANWTDLKELVKSLPVL